MCAKGSEGIWFDRRVLEDLEIYGGSYGIYSGLEESVETWRNLMVSNVSAERA